MKLRLLAILVMALSGATLDLYADCSAAPGVNVSVSPHPDGSVDLTIPYSFPDTTTAGQRSIELFVARAGASGSGYLGKITPDTSSGTWELTHDLSCERSGTYTYTAVAIACGSHSLKTQASSSHAHDAEPTVDIFFDGPDGDGQGTVRVDYKFPNTASPDQRRLEHGIIFPNGNGGAGGTYLAPDREGTWTFPFDMRCLRSGEYIHEVIARRCNASVVNARDPVTLDAKPTVSISADGPDEEGQITVDITYGFPETDDAAQRTVQAWRVSPNGTSGDILGNYHPVDQFGTVSVTIDAFCDKEPVVLQARATSCNRETADAETTAGPAAKPKVTLTLLKVNGTYEGRIDYDMGEANSGWMIKADMLKWITADGKEHEGGPVLNPEVPPQRVGVRTFTFEPPHLARQVFIRATAVSCIDRATSDASIPCGCDATGDPVYFTDGNVRVTDADPLPPIANQGLIRTYDSDEQVVGLFGRGWTTLFERRMILNTDENEQIVSLVTATNEVVTFRGVGGVFRQTWPQTAAAVGTLVRDAATGTYAHRAAGSAEAAVFRESDGRLLLLRDLTTGREAQLAYDAQGLPLSLTDSWSGTSWNITLDVQNRRVSSISISSLPDVTWSYAYDATGNLTSVLAPGGATWRTYEYVANRMTASRDALGNLIESHTYDANGYGISSTGPNDEISNIEYNLPGIVPEERVTRVTYKTGATAEYALRPVGGAYQSVRVTGGCGTCGAHDTTYARDERGRIIRAQDARGYITLSAYDPVTHNLVSTTTSMQPFSCDPATDPARCRLTPEALAEVGVVASRSTLTTNYEYGDPTWPERPTVIRTDSLINVLSRRGDVGVLSDEAEEQRARRETFTYDAATGTVLTRAVSGWTAGRYETRTSTTTLYDGVEAAAFDPGGSFQSSWLLLAQPAGVRKAIDGPRSDVTDVTLFVYYPVDASVPAGLRGRLAATRNAAGHMVRYEAYDPFGNVTRMSDPNGVVRESTYDTLGRLTASTLKGIPGCDTAADALCATDLTQTLSYYAAGPMQSETRAGGGVTTYTYDSRGRVQSISRGPAATDLRERVEYSYDPATGKKSLERILAFDTATENWIEKRREAFTYDVHGLLQRVTHADGTFIEYGYDSAHQLVSMRDENHTADPTAAPNTRYAYSPAGRLERVTQTLATAPEGAGVVVTTYAYDARGNLSGVVDPNGNETSYLYDDFDQVVQTISPVTGTTTYAYDAAGQLMSTTDANDASTVRTYDALGRVLTATSTRPGAATEVVTWTYDASDAARFAVGRLASMSDPAGSTVYSYDRRGLLREETRSFPGAAYSYTTGFTYDRDGNRTAVVYPSTQLTVNYTFDYAGRPKSAAGFVTDADYLPFGPMTRMQLANGTTQSFEYDARYRIEKNELVVDGAPSASPPIVKYTYGYDAVGNITSILDTLDNGYHRHFEYDQLHRLVKANTGRELWGKGTYVWDAMGNMLSYELGRVTDSGPEPILSRARPKPPNTRSTVPRGRTGSFTYAGTTPQLESATTNGVPRSVRYDAAGNEVSFFATRTYSPRNLMQHVADLAEAEDQPHTLTYTYDGRGIRSIRAESPSDGPGTAARRYYLYAPELRLLAETRDDGPNVWTFSSVFDKDVKYEIVWFGDRPVAQVTPGGSALFTFADHLGTPILQTDSTANVMWRVEYEPFGNVYEMRAGTRTEQPLRFPGQELAMTWEGPEENYNVHRWYRSGWGRYTQADPLGVVLSEVNQYIYVSGDPLSRIDPLGLVSTSFKFTDAGHSKKKVWGIPVPGTGQFNLAWASVQVKATCEGCGSEYYVRLHADVDLRYYCTGATACAHEIGHALIAKNFVKQAVTNWEYIEDIAHTSMTACLSAAYNAAAHLQANLTSLNAWGTPLVKAYTNAQNAYEQSAP